MHPALRLFVKKMAGVVAVTLMAVATTAFLTMPFIMEHHPGEPYRADDAVLRHMT